VHAGWDKKSNLQCHHCLHLCSGSVCKKLNLDKTRKHFKMLNFQKWFRFSFPMPQDCTCLLLSASTMPNWDRRNRMQSEIASAITASLSGTEASTNLDTYWSIDSKRKQTESRTKAHADLEGQAKRHLLKRAKDVDASIPGTTTAHNGPRQTFHDCSKLPATTIRW